MNGRLDLVRELKSLRKGGGLFASRIEDRVGPILRGACRITEDDGPVAVRRKVAARLAELSEQLPENLRLATLAAFAINSEARLPLYQDRVHWAAIRIDRDQRTVRRRVDDAINQLAELATEAPHSQAGEEPSGWHTTELRVAVVLDRPRPEVLEQRRIIADRDGLREVDLEASLPAGHGEVDVHMFYGGTLIDRGMTSSPRSAYALTLPKPVSRGDSHDFAVRFRLPTAHAMQPYLMCVPRRSCELFDLRVRFGQERTPSRVWTLHGAGHTDASDPVCQGMQQPVDHAGEVHLRFRQLAPGLIYGVRWETGVNRHDANPSPRPLD